MFDVSGTFLGSITVNEISVPKRIEIHDEMIYILDRIDGTIKKFDLYSNEYLGSIEFAHVSTSDFGFDKHGNMYSLSAFSLKIVKLDPHEESVPEFAEAFAANDDRLPNAPPTGMDVTANGKIYVTVSDGDNIQRILVFAADGMMVDSVESYETKEEDDSNTITTKKFSNPLDVAVDDGSSGIIYVSDHVVEVIDGKVQRSTDIILLPPLFSETFLCGIEDPFAYPAPLPQDTSDSLNAGELLARADILYEKESNGDHLESFSHYRAVLNQDFDNTSAWTAIGNIQLKCPQITSFGFEHTLEVDPTHVNANIGIANYYTKILSTQKDVPTSAIEQNIARYESVIGAPGYSNSSNTNALNGKAENLMLLERYSEALDTFTESLQIMTKVQTLNGIAAAYYHLNNFGSSILHYEKVLEIDPTNYDALNGIILSHIANNEMQEVAKYDKRLEESNLKQQIIDNLLDEEWELAKRNQNTEALRFVDVILIMDPANGDALQLEKEIVK